MHVVLNCDSDIFFPELGSGLTDFCNADEEQVCIILQTADFDT